MSHDKDICDFCASPHVARRFDCRDFASESAAAGVLYPETIATDRPTNVILASRNYWAACAECADLVDNEHVDKLIRRALDEHAKRYGRRITDRDDVTKHLRRTYRLFFDNRIRVA